jgi:hypothetical protein
MEWKHWKIYFISVGIIAALGILIICSRMFGSH